MAKYTKPEGLEPAYYYTTTHVVEFNPSFSMEYKKWEEEIPNFVRDLNAYCNLANITISMNNVNIKSMFQIFKNLPPCTVRFSFFPDTIIAQTERPFSFLYSWLISEYKYNLLDLYPNNFGRASWQELIHNTTEPFKLLLNKQQLKYINLHESEFEFFPQANIFNRTRTLFSNDERKPITRKFMEEINNILKQNLEVKIYTKDKSQEYVLQEEFNYPGIGAPNPVKEKIDKLSQTADSVIWAVKYLNIAPLTYEDLVNFEAFAYNKERLIKKYQLEDLVDPVFKKVLEPKEQIWLEKLAQKGILPIKIERIISEKKEGEIELLTEIFNKTEVELLAEASNQEVRKLFLQKIGQKSDKELLINTIMARGNCDKSQAEIFIKQMQNQIYDNFWVLKGVSKDFSITGGPLEKIPNEARKLVFKLVAPYLLLTDIKPEEIEMIPETTVQDRSYPAAESNSSDETVAVLAENAVNIEFE